MSISGERYRFIQTSVDNAPDVAGVYALYDGDELIYIGRALGGDVTIRSRLQDHLAGRGGDGTDEATAYRREPCRNAKAREKELLEEYQQIHGRLPRCNERIG
jgi:hypothetical protein